MLSKVLGPIEIGMALLQLPGCAAVGEAVGDGVGAGEGPACVGADVGTTGFGAGVGAAVEGGASVMVILPPPTIE